MFNSLISAEGWDSPNDCPGYDTKPIWWWHSSNTGALGGIRSTPSLSSLPDLLWPGVVATDRILSMGQIELNSILKLNWIVWIGSFLHWKCVLMLNWIVWNRTVLTFNCV